MCYLNFIQRDLISQIFSFSKKVKMIKSQEQMLEQQQELTEKTRKRRKLLKKIIRNNREAASDRQFDILMNLDKELFAGYNHHRLGNFCIQQNRLQLAEENLNKAKQLIQKKFLFTNVYLSFGNLELKKKNKQKACSYYNKVLQLSPHKNSKQYLNKDQVIFAGKLNSFSSYVDAHKSLIKLYVEMNQYQKGFQICKAATELKELQESALIQFKDILNKLKGNHIQSMKFTREKLVEEIKNRGIVNNEAIEPLMINTWEMSVNQHKKLKKINIITIKWGSKYSAEYVNKLYAGIKKNTSWQIDFYCFTDDHYGIDKNIKVKPLDDQWKKEWGKAVIFGSQIQGKNIYIDLDVIITGNLDPVFQYEGQFGLLRHKINLNDEYPHNGYSSSVMIWKGKTLRQIYDKIVKIFPIIQKLLVKFDFWLDILVQNPDDLSALYPGAIANFDSKNHQSKPPQNSIIVLFPNRPKLSEFPAKWIKQLWAS